MFRLVVSAGALAALVSFAEAAPRCAPGKIYRVSQKTCVDKSAAVRAGVISSRQARAKASAQRRSARLERTKAARAARLEAAREAREERRMARLEAARVSARAADRAPKSIVAQDAPQQRPIILSPVKTVIGSAASPFGALQDPWRSDRVNAPQETLFSLRLSVED